MSLYLSFAISPARRPRLYWLDWALAPATDFSVSVDSSRLRSVSFVPPSTFPGPSSWAEPGWAPVAGPTAAFSYLYHSEFSWCPFFLPCRRSTVFRIRHFQAACRCLPFSALQYEVQFGLTFQSDPSTWRVPSVRERQLLLNFLQFHTEYCMSSAQSSAHSADFELEQLRLLGNSFHGGVVSWLLGH